MDEDQIAAWTERNQIVAKADRLSADPRPGPSSWKDSKGARHWMVTLRQEGRGNPRTITTPFSQGAAHTKAPTAADVLCCLAMDASGYDNARNFEDWVLELGYSPDSRSAERDYHTVAEQAKALRQFLGDALYRELLQGEEVEA